MSRSRPTSEIEIITARIVPVKPNFRRDEGSGIPPHLIAILGILLEVDAQRVMVRNEVAIIHERRVVPDLSAISGCFSQKSWKRAMRSASGTRPASSKRSSR
jgi:hypothetical protein